MPEPRRNTLMFSVTVALCFAAVAAFALSAWSLYSSHQQACASRNASLAVLHDVVVIATTPAPGHPPTSDQRQQIARFRAAVFSRIGSAHCH